jgi:hypothetical protein
VTVDTVVTGIQRAILEPAYMQVIFGVADVLYLGKRLYPINSFRLLGPKTFIVSSLVAAGTG